ncbi:hypothetical protein Tco_1517756 [Tanacetum coccineum]
MFSKPIRYNFVGLWKELRTVSYLNPDIKLCSGYDYIYGQEGGGSGIVKQWICVRDHERQNVRGNGMIFANFFKVRYGNKNINDVTREWRYYEWVAQKYDFKVKSRRATEYSVKDKITHADLFFLNSMDGGELVDVSWNVAKFSCNKAKGVQKRSKIAGAHLIGRIARSLGLMSNVSLKLDDSEEEADAAEYDQFYGEFRLMRVEQERFHSWNSSHMSQLLSYHHLDHTRFDGTQYTYVIDILNLGVQQGVNFMSSPQTYSTAPPDPTANLFVLFGDVPSTSCNLENNMDKD